MIRIVLAVAAMACASAPAFAQASPWTHEGVTFPETAGWCPTKAEDDDGAGGKAMTLKIQPCGKDFPVLSAGIGVREAAAQDIPTFTATAGESSAGDEGKVIVDGIFKRKSESCTRATYAIDNNPVRNLPAFQINATYDCPAIGGTIAFHNTTTYAQQKNGDLWIVAFDSNDAALTAEEEALIRNAVAVIAAR